mmetsp:Transcript_64195/g.139721  ORF Transcript_64195/g.139721 Transcript_64195/m.139721 type:complete len:162 (+) Transcript_64195:81-566(+)
MRKIIGKWRWSTIIPACLLLATCLHGVFIMMKAAPTPAPDRRDKWSFQDHPSLPQSFKHEVADLNKIQGWDYVSFFQKELPALFKLPRPTFHRIPQTTCKSSDIPDSDYFFSNFLLKSRPVSSRTVVCKNDGTLALMTLCTVAGLLDQLCGRHPQSQMDPR